MVSTWSFRDPGSIHLGALPPSVASEEAAVRRESKRVWSLVGMSLRLIHHLPPSTAGENSVT